MLYAYLGPDTFLPLTSIIAAVAGGVLMFGRNLKVMVLGAFRRSGGPAPTASGQPRAEQPRGGVAGGLHPHVRPGAAEGESTPSARTM